MKAHSSFLSVVVLSLFCFNSINAQTPSQQQRQEETPIRLAANEVSLDIVVKDKKGRFVKDLTASDFEVYEDGVRQKVESFRLVVREAAVTGNKAERKPEPAPQTVSPRDDTSFGVVALVFDRLSPEARALARKAGLSYAEQGTTTGDYTGVFAIDQSLRTIQPFTDNAEMVKQAVERATSTATSVYASSGAKIRDLSSRSTALDQQISSQESAAAEAGADRNSAGAAAAGAAIGQAAAQQALIEMQVRIAENFEALERDQQGFATINSLLAVITSMRNLPGRKTIIFFSEGLALPPSVQTKFPAVINAANRASVSIYAIDSAGLRIESGTAEAAQEINSLAARRMQQAARGNDRITSAPYTKALERNEDLLRLDPRNGLGTLADETGGFLIHDTNDLVAGLRRIDDDMHGYYMLTYVPKNDDYDGKFRHITVKLSRPNLEAQTRKGYYAVESIGSWPVLDYEAPAIAALRRARSDLNASSLRAAAMSFPATNKPGLTVVLAEAPLSSFTLAPANDKKTYNADFSIVAIVRDESRQVVQKLSQHYPLSGPADKLEAAKRGDVLFYREMRLKPGRYTIEFVAYDAPTGKASVRTADLEVAPFDETKPRLSSVVVLKRAERLTPNEQKKDQPFHFGDTVVYPNLGEPVLKSQAKQLAFFFTAWQAKGSAGPLKLTLEIFQNGRRLGQTSGQLPSPDEQGRIKYASALPLDSFEPAVYELKITVSDAAASVSRSTRFTVQP
ncbi:MAG TPA: VWA domain-containing protein [Blastocatellia bacterium]|nr:VWA domain-containing protein [Blastocatellia bacterium]